ncbi:hypothetical protein C8A03DRAFT_37840 [Achaetomium macrosporum]|uniref:Helicase ATP-binding domain-containing protein n=1 Tax=Achaetomium macrosporum TaxID=79813 RepID=A0AAN7C2X0_9PEZI|nr:hypothetical protein C8A03DRAFT_37840 [Achaetomium macrosporum]
MENAPRAQGAKRRMPALCLGTDRDIDEDVKRRRLTVVCSDSQAEERTTPSQVDLSSLQVILRKENPDGSRVTLRSDAITNWLVDPRPTNIPPVHSVHIDCEKLFRTFVGDCTGGCDALAPTQVMAAHLEPVDGIASGKFNIASDSELRLLVLHLEKCPSFQYGGGPDLPLLEFLVRDVSSAATVVTNPVADVGDAVDAAVQQREEEDLAMTEASPAVETSGADDDFVVLSERTVGDYAREVVTGDADNEGGNKGSDDGDGHRSEGEMNSDDDTGNDGSEPRSDEAGPSGEAGGVDAAPGELKSVEEIMTFLHVPDDLQFWADTCRFFCHDEARTAHDQGVKLLGTKRSLRPHQMEDVFALLQRSFRGEYDGGIVALDTGLGKTIVSLAAVAATRLVELNYHTVKDEWRRATRAQNAGATVHRRHNPEGVSASCPSGNPWSIECCCVDNSFSLRIAKQLHPAPSLVVTPVGVAEHIVREASAYFEEEIVWPGSDNGEHGGRRSGFVDTIDMGQSGATLSPEIRNDILTHYLDEPPKWARRKKGQDDKLVEGPRPKMGYTLEQEKRLFLQHRLVVVGSNPTSFRDKGKKSTCFARDFDLCSVDPRKRTTKKYTEEWAVAPRFIVLDEFHQFKGERTILYTALRRIRDQTEQYRNRFKLVALSASPLSASLEKALEQLLSLIVSAIDLNTFRTAAQIIDKIVAAKGRKPKDSVKYQEAIRTCSDMLKRVMTVRTSTDTFHGQKLLELPPLDLQEIPCSSARTRKDDFRHKMYELREAWRKDALKSVAQQQDFLQFAQFSDSFMQTLWLASFPGIVDLPPHLSSNPAAWLNSDRLPKVITTKQGRSSHTVGKYIDVITRGSGKMEQLRVCLEQACRDEQLRWKQPVAGEVALKKHACVFVTRPGLALIIAAHADKHWSSQWDVVLVLSASAKDGSKAIADAFRDIPITDSAKPTLFIGTVGTCGTGLDTLKRANHGILFDLPFVEANLKQVRGRIWRAGQRFRCYWTELWAEDSEAESLIRDRHLKRADAFGRILDDLGGSSSKAEGGGQ